MKKILYLFIFLFISVSCTGTKPQEIKVMSFNIWVGGGKQPIKQTANVMLQAQADIIGIQESVRNNDNSAVRIADSLGWYSYAEARRTIVSKYPIVDTSENKHGVKIQISPNKYVWMFNVHLAYCPYEPYQLNGIEYCGAPLLSTADEAEQSAWKSRSKHVLSVIEDINNAKKQNCPVFLTGDFNEPSCLDWTERAVNAGLCVMPVIWPSTKAFTEQAQMHDAYRTFLADEVQHPGHTWTCLPTAEGEREVMDRIDFVFYNGELALQNVQIVGEVSDKSDIKIPEYPSDHRAVVATFTYYIKSNN